MNYLLKYAPENEQSYEVRIVARESAFNGPRELLFNYYKMLLLFPYPLNSNYVHVILCLAKGDIEESLLV